MKTNFWNCILAVVVMAILTGCASKPQRPLQVSWDHHEMNQDDLDALLGEASFATAYIGPEWQQFRVGSSMLTPDQQDFLRKLGENLVYAWNEPQMEKYAVLVVGHSDASGDPLRNELLSQERAKRAAQVIREGGGLGLPVLAWGVGSAFADPNANAEEQAAERCVEIRIGIPTDVEWQKIRAQNL